MTEQPTQLVLFGEPNGNGPARSHARGPRGLLLALLERGLDEDAVETAAALVLELDAGAREGACAATS